MIRLQFHPLLLRYNRLRLGVATSCLRRFSRFQPGAGPSDHTSPSAARATNISAGSRPYNSPRPRTQRGVDARSLGASVTDGRPPIFRGPGIRGPMVRKPNPARNPSRGTGPRSLKPRRRREATQMPEEEEGDNERAKEVTEVYRELAEKSKPVPVRHEPERPDFSTLGETWPSLPTDVSSYARCVSEKLAKLSERYPNGYEPANELGRRLYEGKPVLFSSDAEKDQAVTEAKKLSQKHADKLTQEKGDLVEPRDISFEPISEESRKSLLSYLVKGDYSDPEPELAANKQPVFSDIVANLRNNATYRTSGKAAQLIAKVDSILSASRPSAAKR